MTSQRHPRRAAQLLVGLWLYGATMALMIRAGLGLDPWDVFHQGLTHHLPLSFGAVTALVGVLVLLAWIPLRQRPRIGTVLNVVVIAVAVDVTLGWVPTPADHEIELRCAMLVAAIVGNGLAGAMYVGADLGTGPRDGLWVGLVMRTGRSVRSVRTSIELTVLAVGFALGGTVNFGTVLYALAIGPTVQLFLPLLRVEHGAGEAPVTVRPAKAGAAVAAGVPVRAGAAVAAGVPVEARGPIGDVHSSVAPAVLPSA